MVAAVTYSKINGSFNWHQAKAACQAQGLELATVRSDDEHKLLKDAIGNNNLWFTSWTWLGGKRDPNNAANWIWENNDQISKTYWNPGEPNNVANNENCIMFYNNPPTWNDSDCDNNVHAGYANTYALCEERLTDIVQGKKLCGRCPVTGNDIICDGKIKVFPEFHLNFDLKFTKLEKGNNNWRSILRIGDTASDRAPGIYVTPNSEHTFHFSINYDDNKWAQYAKNVDVPAMADLKPHNFDLKVYRKDYNCVYDCTGQVEISIDGVSHGVEDMGKLNKLTRISDAYTVKEKSFYISEPVSLSSFPAYPLAKIGNIIYEDWDARL